jgi:hypothetical protein
VSITVAAAETLQVFDVSVPNLDVWLVFEGDLGAPLQALLGLPLGIAGR